MESIDRLVHIIQSDSLLEKVAYKNIKPSDKRELNEIDSIVVFYKNAEIVKIKPYKSDLIQKNDTIEFYLNNNKLIYIFETHFNNSRPGSCGMISIEDKLYYKKNKLIGSKSIEKPFLCYDEKINDAALFAFFEKIYGYIYKTTTANHH